MFFVQACRTIALSLIATSLMIACAPPAPTIKIAQEKSPSDKAALITEITRRLVVEGLGYPVEMVQLQASDALEDILAQRLDVALFVNNAEPRGVLTQCSTQSYEAVSLGQSCEDEASTKVVSCSLKNKSGELFDLIAKIKFAAADIEDALFWKEDNKANIAESATYFLHNNEVGKSGWKKWVNEGSVANLKAAIKKDMEGSALQF